MSAEDCILYRKIGDDWCVLGYGFTFAEAELDDCEFRKASTLVKFEDLFTHLERLNAKYVTEFGICYAGEFISDTPPEVPQKHRVLCCIPDSERKETLMSEETTPVAPVRNIVLLPCPFCGDRAKLVDADELDVWRVYCEYCGVRHEATTKQRVIVAWNNRRANGLVNWLDAEAAKYQASISSGIIGGLDAKCQELRRCRKMVKRLLGQ